MSEYFPFSSETSAESDTGKSPERSKSKKKKSFELGKAAAPAIIEAPKFEALKFEKKPEQPDRVKELLHGRSLVETSAEKETAETSGKEGLDKKTPKAERRGEDAEAPLEALSTAESHEAVKRYVGAQKEAIGEDAEVKEEEPEAAAHAKAEDAADVALLDAVEEKLAADPEKPVAEALDEAEAEVAERIEAEAEAAGELAAGELLGAEGVPENDAEDIAEIPSEGEVPLAGEPVDDEIVLHPSTPGSPPPSGGAGGSGSGGGTVPPRSGSSGGASGAAGGSGGPGGPNFNAAPAATEAIEVQDITAERRAMAQGVLVGGLVGYLIGRRRGRIKAEKRLKPIQRKLEKQVNELHDTVAEREQSIRKLAREKSEALAASKVAQQRFAERLATPRAEELAAAAERAARVQLAEQGNAAERGLGNRQGAVANRFERSTIAGARRAERFISKTVEAPAVILAAAATLRAERRRETEPAVDFTKKIEAYSPQELDRAAEKIKVDGTTLKELARTHNLDERAVRRVVGEFIAGGNIKEALTHAMVEKELQFERDPKLRRARQTAMLGAGGAAVVASSDDGPEFGEGPDNGGTSGNGATGSCDHATSDKKPTPDKATIDKLRKQQMTQVSIAGAIVVIFALVIAALLF